MNVRIVFVEAFIWALRAHLYEIKTIAFLMTNLSALLGCLFHVSDYEHDIIICNFLRLYYLCSGKFTIAI